MVNEKKQEMSAIQVGHSYLVRCPQPPPFKTIQEAPTSTSTPTPIRTLCCSSCACSSSADCLRSESSCDWSVACGEEVWECRRGWWVGRALHA